jgi:SusD family.
MKAIKKYLCFAIVSLMAVSCTDILDTNPEGRMMTASQKREASEKNPELISADVNAMYALMIQAFEGLGEAEEFHTDFGYASVCMFLDKNGQDIYSINGGYNWFTRSQSFTDRVYTSPEAEMVWVDFYKQIRAANEILNIIDADEDNPVLLQYRGQALAYRAFNYFNLAQMYQFNYAGNQTKPCVPIITEATTDDVPRSTVEEVYTLVMDDLNAAIENLKGYSRPTKGFIDQAVAYGIKAQVNLTMQNWSAAAADAAEALRLSKATPYTLTQVSSPTFNSAKAASVIWANIVVPDNDIVETGIINWPSHMCSFSGNGYVSVGAYRYISRLLYDQIPNTDVRKGWWLDESLQSPLVAGSKYDAWRAAAYTLQPYVNVKFGAYEDQPMNETNSQDWTIMRAEEMLFIQAEGLAMSGDIAGGKQILENFVKTNRNSAYVCSANNPADFQNEIFMQRRIEFWGEGKSYFDIMRLNKPITRIENGISSYPTAHQFNIAGGDQILLWIIPQAEIQANTTLNEGDNNPTVPAPRP